MATYITIWADPRSCVTCWPDPQPEPGLLTLAKAVALRTSWPTRTAMVTSSPSTTAQRMPLGRWNVQGRSMLMESLRLTLFPARRFAHRQKHTTHCEGRHLTCVSHRVYTVTMIQVLPKQVCRVW